MKKEDFKLTITDQTLDEKIEKSINTLIAQTIYLVNNLIPETDLSLEDCKIIKDKGRIEATASSIITQMYYDEEKQNYLFLSSSLIRDLATKHILYNSNKRTAFFTGKYFLIEKMQINFSMSKEEAINFVKNIVLNHEKNMNLEKQLGYIQNKILDHSVKLEKQKQEKTLKYMIDDYNNPQSETRAIIEALEKM